MKKKYIRFNYSGFIVFDSRIIHATLGDAQRQCSGASPTSAGFCERNEEGEWICYGESISLRLKARPSDSADLNEFLK